MLNAPRFLSWFEDAEARMTLTGVAPLCSTAGCVQDAAVYDYETGDGRCFDCAELLVERWEAAALNRGFAATLPRLNER